MRRDAFGRRVAQRRAVINGGQAAPELHFAFEIKRLRRFIGGIDAARRFEPLELRLIERKARRLPFLAIARKAEPVEIGPDRIDKRLGQALGIGIVDAQQKAAAMLFCPQVIVERGADIADVEAARGRRGKAGGDGHADSSGTFSDRAAAASRPSRVTSVMSRRMASSR